MKDEEQNTNFKLIIRRKNEITGIAMKTNILVCDIEHSSVRNNSMVEFNLPRKLTKIKLYNKIPLSRNIVKEFVVDPMMNNTVDVCIYYKINWLANIPPLNFILPGSTIKTDISYY